MTQQQQMKSVLELIIEKHNILEGNEIIYLQDQDRTTGLRISNLKGA
jgi:hypothetical protein